MVLVWLVGVLVIFIVVYLFVINRKPKDYPNGPFIFPLVGNIPQMVQGGKQQRKHLFAQFTKKYGKIFSLKMGPISAVVLTDHKLVREAWSNPNICGRPKLEGSAARTGGVIRGIIFQDGEEWQEQRRFALRHLKNFGFGKRSIETVIMDEVVELINGFKNDCGKPISTQTRFNVAVLNSLWAIAAGQRYSHDDPILHEIVECIYKSIQFKEYIFFFPWIKDYFPNISGWKEYLECVSLPYNFLKQFVQSRLASFGDGNCEPEHFTDVFIAEIRKMSDTKSSFYKERGEETLVATLLDLFVAGIETTSTTLTYALLYTALFRDKQQKLHEEIDRVIGSRLVSLQDRKNLPYTGALIQEVLRFSSLVPTGLGHLTLADVMIGPYRIPKGKWVIANLQGIHHDPEIWGDPEKFRPERFLVEREGGTVEVIYKNEALLPFSCGKRACLGECLAKDELFLFIVGIFQAFRVETDPNSEMPTTDQLDSMIIAVPKPHKLIFSERCKDLKV